MNPESSCHTVSPKWGFEDFRENVLSNAAASGNKGVVQKTRLELFLF